MGQNDEEARIAYRTRARQWLEAYWERQFYVLFGHVSEQMALDRSMHAIEVLVVWRELLADEAEAADNLCSQMLERLDLALIRWYREAKKADDASQE